MIAEQTDDVLARKYQQLSALLDERAWRLCLSADAQSLGYGGVSRVAKVAGVSRTTIHTGIKELAGCSPTVAVGQESGRIRRPGAGRKRRVAVDKTLLADLDRLLDPVTRGDPESALCWTCKSTTRLAAELRSQGHRVSQATVWRLLDALGYSMQSNRKTREGTDHPDRNAQFEYINSSAQAFLREGCPVISVDTKKKELIGEYKNAGREWTRVGQPVEVNMHDFADPSLGKAIPYGVYDIGRNEGWVSVGVTHDTAAFAVATIRRWWERMGRPMYAQADALLVTADGGGSNGSRVRLWKVEIQRLSDELGIPIHVRHFPPGTSKWNKIEHRMFCHITENWRGKPLRDRMAIVNLISNTTTAKGLTIQADIDELSYETGKKVSDETMKTLAIEKCSFHGEWNYSVIPRRLPP